MKNPLPDLEIPQELLNRIIEHARKEHPMEICGILAGKDGKVTNFYPMVNTEKSSSSYRMEPEEQLRVFLEIERKGLELSAIYHSHPHTSAFPSQRDVDNAFYPDYLILIISLMEKEVPRIEAFQIEKAKIERKALRVTGKDEILTILPSRTWNTFEEHSIKYEALGNSSCPESPDTPADSTANSFYS